MFGTESLRNALQDNLDSKNRSRTAKITKGLIGPGLMASGGGAMVAGGALAATGMLAPIIPFGVLTAGAGVFTVATAKTVWNTGWGVLERLREKRQGVDVRKQADEYKRQMDALESKIGSSTNQKVIDKAERAKDRLIGQVERMNVKASSKEIDAIRTGNLPAQKNFGSAARTTDRIRNTYDAGQRAELVAAAKEELSAIIQSNVMDTSAIAAEIKRITKLDQKFTEAEAQDLITYAKNEIADKKAYDKMIADLNDDFKKGADLIDAVDWEDELTKP